MYDQTSPKTTIEVLTPDFRNKEGALEAVIAAKPDVFNHNLETVPRLYTEVRPGARYYHSLRLLDRAKAQDPAMFTKSGIMVGLGEERREVLQVMDDLRSADVDFITIGQYLQPTRRHHDVLRFVEHQVAEVDLAQRVVDVAAQQRVAALEQEVATERSAKEEAVRCRAALAAELQCAQAQLMSLQHQGAQAHAALAEVDAGKRRAELEALIARTRTEAAEATAHEYARVRKWKQNEQDPRRCTIRRGIARFVFSFLRARVASVSNARGPYVQ